MTFSNGLVITVALLALGSLSIILRMIYNVVFHPLAHIPGPFWARASGIPSWYYAKTGNRHIWLNDQFQTYGYRIRPEPNTVLFRDADAYKDIYGIKSNVRRSQFYEALRSDDHENTLTCIDVLQHAHKRKMLSLCFTDKSLNAACGFIVEHLDRWLDIISENISGASWSNPIDFTDSVDALLFDIMGDLCFGRTFGIKEPGENPLKVIPHLIAEYMLFYYPLCRSPFLPALVWLKPYGLDKLMDAISPPPIKQYNKFVYDSVTQRIALQKEQQEVAELDRRQDIFYFLCEARDPDTNKLAYRERDLRSEASLLIVAGTDTIAVSLSGILFYITSDLARCEKLAGEILATFDSVEDIVYGPKLTSCLYLRACIDEGMRLTPSGPCELPREVLPGGLLVKGEYYPPRTIVGTVAWADSRNEEVYGDADSFRPERWIVDESRGVTKEQVATLKYNFHPFSSGPGSCVGKNIAMAEMMMTVARMLYRFEVRRSPGSTVGCGHPDWGWGRRDKNQFQLLDAYISLRKGPELQFRRRTTPTGPHSG
ncbi:benzoate 4-monooxygenase cytochrome P450 [Xylariaceae sp. FL0255]|nr:benzoate 4-monooxygenase cytochrome P450 [Xylariaceae sp. FL0255]